MRSRRSAEVEAQRATCWLLALWLAGCQWVASYHSVSSRDAPAPLDTGMQDVPHRGDAAPRPDADAGQATEAGTDVGEPPLLHSGAFSKCNDGGAWCSLQPPLPRLVFEPDESDLWLGDVWGNGPTDVYVVGRDGMIGHFDGQQWRLQLAQLPPPPAGSKEHYLEGVWGSPGGDIFAVGRYGWVVRGRSGQWTPEQLTTSNGKAMNLEGVWVASATELYVAADSRRIFHKTQAGWHLELRAECGSGSQFEDVWGSAADDIYVVGSCTDSSGINAGVVLHSSGANTWTNQQVGSVTLRGVWGSATAGVFVVGDGGIVWHKPPGSGSGAGAWTSTSVGQGDLAAVAGNDQDVYAVGAAGSIWHRSLSQGGWTQIASPTGRGLNGVWVDASGVCFAVGGGGTIVRHVPAGL